VPNALERSFAKAKVFAAGYHVVVEKGIDVPGRLGRVTLLLFGCLVIALIASARININEFSLHNFYKNRLSGAISAPPMRPRGSPTG
jgi:hypothetical protein